MCQVGGGMFSCASRGPASLFSHFGSLISLENLSVGLMFSRFFFSMLLRTMRAKGQMILDQIQSLAQ